MADSTLDLTGEETPTTTLGHGTGALGPSDSSDSGSDVLGGPGMDEGLSDEQARRMPQTIHATAGRDLGDDALDSDSDRAGTGERAGAGVQGSPANDLSLSVQSEDGDDGDGAPTDEDVQERLDDVPASDGAT